jgi:hypothetical protein
MEDDSTGGMEENGDFPISTESSTSSDKGLLQALKLRQRELERGIGKRYITRTQKGFLNVHKEVSRKSESNP